jgi:hypothetical protein
MGSAVLGWGGSQAGWLAGCVLDAKSSRLPAAGQLAAAHMPRDGRHPTRALQLSCPGTLPLPTPNPAPNLHLPAAFSIPGMPGVFVSTGGLFGGGGGGGGGGRGGRDGGARYGQRAPVHEVRGPGAAPGRRAPARLPQAAAAPSAVPAAPLA